MFNVMCLAPQFIAGLFLFRIYSVVMLLRILMRGYICPRILIAEGGLFEGMVLCLARQFIGGSIHRGLSAIRLAEHYAD